MPGGASAGGGANGGMPGGMPPGGAPGKPGGGIPIPIMPGGIIIGGRGIIMPGGIGIMPGMPGGMPRGGGGRKPGGMPAGGGGRIGGAPGGTGGAAGTGRRGCTLSGWSCKGLGSVGAWPCMTRVRCAWRPEWVCAPGRPGGGGRGSGVVGSAAW